MTLPIRGIAIYLAAAAASLALFWFVPNIDLLVSGLFYDRQHGFTLAAWPPLVALGAATRWITGAVLLTAAGGATWLRLVGRPLWVLDRNALIFLVAALAIGPGILVNTVLKDHWGRARPYQIEAFGGAHQFAPAALPSDQCTRNCSFVSGDAALGFSLVGFAFLLPAGRRRRIAFGAALALGALIALGRIATGHHFLSDVVDAGLLVFGTTWLLHRWLVVHDGVTPIARLVVRLSETPAGRSLLWVAGFIFVEFAAMIWIDRPVANFFHDDGGALRPVFGTVQAFGLGYPYLVPTALAFAFLRWGGAIERLRPHAAAMRAAAYVPGFVFVAIAGSGLIADALKVSIGRTRPKLLFADGTYDFTWFGLHADHWSFPSGHATTAAALMTALWCLWPWPFWLYVSAAALVAVSRVITAQHYLSDVIAGAALGVAVTRGLASWLLKRRDAAPASPTL